MPLADISTTIHPVWSTWAIGSCEAFETHINVEDCNSVKSIKYICKYVNKGSEMAVFGVTNANDEISQYQMGRY
ncbi:uncharacterized protein Dana_GF26789 [Drosophila ananassae]|uniref:Uncharacterized protein n=1 Tax=Drosophila ananassae TaxID=7217 RepID=A0A0P9ABG5_DROAN|nr:uncharacterized protein Dana_GF26789 [Drosophila ananassae]